jgi:hypothetical protein
MIILALVAGHIGADADNEWGPLRIWILILGLVGLFFPIGLKIIEVIDRRLIARPWSPGLRSRVEMIFDRQSARVPDLSKLSEPPEVAKIDGPYIEDLVEDTDQQERQKQATRRSISSTFAVPRRALALVMLFIAVELLYIWFVSVGYMTTWPSTSNVYGMLAESFTQGQVALQIEPDPQLAELENPYPTAERPGIKVFKDASYFEGKYYIYWGPAPAVFAALWKIATSRTLGDEHIVFLAVSCIFVFSVLILLNLRRKYFPALPGWLFVVGVLIVATAHPILWVLNWPTIYPAAIASGQAFLLAGLFFAIPVLDGSKRENWRLVLVGALWSLAFGSRMLLVGAIGILTLATAISLYSTKNGKRQIYEGMKKSVMLIMPLVLGVALLGFYNYVRYGNFLETGFRYMMSRNDLPRMLESGLVFNPIYLLPNLFYLLIAPIQFRAMFPIIRPLWRELSAVSMFLARFNIPDEYHIEDITGILVAMPTIIFVGYLVWEMLCNWRLRSIDEKRVPEHKQTQGRNPGFRRTIWVILFAAILAATPIFLFFWVATRYFLDAVPLFAILAAVGAWLLYEATRGFPLKGPLAVIFILTTVFLGMLISFLLAISGADSRFDDLNPALFETLSGLFSLKQ